MPAAIPRIYEYQMMHGDEACDKVTVLVTYVWLLMWRKVIGPVIGGWLGDWKEVIM